MKLVPYFGVGVLASLMAIPASAQTLAPGSWAGTLRVGGARVAVEYVVQSGDSLAVTMKTASGPASPVTDLKVGERNLAFRWGAFSCALDKKGSNKYEGDCKTDDGTAAQLSLNAPEARPSTPPRGGRDVITAEELAATKASTLYQAIQKIHPEWLLLRPPSSINYDPAPVQAYVNGQHMGGADFLRSLPIDGVLTVQHYSGTDATQRWGTNHGSGAIAVTQRAPDPN
jgi:hypothetical protein